MGDEEDGGELDWRLIRKKGSKKVSDGIKVSVVGTFVTIVSFAFGQNDAAYVSLTTLAGRLGGVASGY